jgi:hypothetical protein
MSRPPSRARSDRRDLRVAGDRGRVALRAGRSDRDRRHVAWVGRPERHARRSVPPDVHDGGDTQRHPVARHSCPGRHRVTSASPRSPCRATRTSRRVAPSRRSSDRYDSVCRSVAGRRRHAPSFLSPACACRGDRFESGCRVAAACRATCRSTGSLRRACGATFVDEHRVSWRSSADWRAERRPIPAPPAGERGPFPRLCEAVSLRLVSCWHG